jgi:hypothetical protein
MRTTIRLQDELLDAAKRRAAETGRTLTRFIEDALREALAERSLPSSAQGRFEVRPFEGRGLRPGVDLDSNAALLDVMEDR